MRAQHPPQEESKRPTLRKPEAIPEPPNTGLLCSELNLYKDLPVFTPPHIFPPRSFFRGLQAISGSPAVQGEPGVMPGSLLVHLGVVTGETSRRALRPL